MDSDGIDWGSFLKKILGSYWEKSKDFFFFFFCHSFNLTEKDFAKEKSTFPNCLASVWQVVAGSH